MSASLHSHGSNYRVEEPEPGSQHEHRQACSGHYCACMLDTSCRALAFVVLHCVSCSADSQAVQCLQFLYLDTCCHLRISLPGSSSEQLNILLDTRLWLWENETTWWLPRSHFPTNSLPSFLEGTLDRQYFWNICLFSWASLDFIFHMQPARM